MADLQSPGPPRSTADLFGDPVDSHPVWFKQSSFLQPNFDSESYIADRRTFVPFETLRSELHSHLSSLKHELVDLINRDYADFVNLSTKLVDVDAAVVRMRAPLSEIREKILVFCSAVEASLLALQTGLRQRAEASAAREVLELLLDTFHVVSKVEKLIKELPSVPADWSNGDVNFAEKDLDHLSNGFSIQHTENETNIRETQSVLLDRIASEMNRFKFYITHAQNLPFIENMEKRIQNASLLLDASLGHCFVDGLEHRDANVIFNCLRAYAAIDNTRRAEEIFRSTVVAPLIQKIIPHSSSGVVGGGASGDELEEDYKKIKQYIEKDCKFLLEISSTENSGLHVFSFLSNSILIEVLSAIQKGRPWAFSPGRPTEFLKNYKSSLDFLAHLEGYCPSRSAVAKFRAEAVYAEFMKQWNVGVYFSLRFQEIAGALDSALAGASLVPIQTSHSERRNSQDLTLKPSVTLLECLKSCWREDVVVLSCSDKLFRLSLQLLSRYSNWLSSGLAARKAGNAGSNPGSEWAISAVPDDFVYIIHDLNCLVAEICGDFLRHVIGLLSSCSTEVLEPVEQSILQGAKSLKDLIPIVMNSIIEAVVKKSVEDLKQLKGITATYRMTNKPLPVRHSPYVSGVLHPLKAFLDGERANTYLTRDIRDELLHGAAFEITGHYHELVADLVSLAKKTDSSLLRIRQGAQRRGGASSDVSENNVSNTDKICMQLFLDVQEYGRNLSALGVEAAKIPAYRSLRQCVAPTDSQNTIRAGLAYTK
ncbi:Conserved oligomeric Golgi complex subunit 2 [Camellia lanceoleosa]|uniref:Conserved oligomeric Golgi complex subunit 2 n=1 Tax=Camellia lanceoleosa TaxID=1840588 RepID=A0ACC0FBN7_9ERIC|nr:Conserved oligomeric Golgi complex subunit 2 [Camellia lanceoleosa]